MNAEQIVELRRLAELFRDAETSLIENKIGFVAFEDIRDSYKHATKPAMILGLLDALDAARKERQWRPIETAPQDSQRVVLWANGRIEIGELVCGYSPTDLAYRRVGGGAHNFFIENPTMWQPLPPPPDAEGGK